AKRFRARAAGDARQGQARQRTTTHRAVAVQPAPDLRARASADDARPAGQLERPDRVDPRRDAQGPGPALHEDQPGLSPSRRPVGLGMLSPRSSAAGDAQVVVAVVPARGADDPAGAARPRVLAGRPWAGLADAGGLLRRAGMALRAAPAGQHPRAP